MRTQEEIEESIQKEINNWKKRLNRKGPFYLYEQKLEKRYDWSKEVNFYYVIWNDKHKTKYGFFHDEMATRYGVVTCCVLNGDTKFDLWNGSTINDEIFDRMLEVRHDV